MKRSSLWPAIVLLLLAFPSVPGSAAQGEPAEGTKFQLFGTAMDDLDPENPFNELISISNAGLAFGGAERKLGDQIQVVMLDNQIELKHYFVGRTCGGGSPRIQLAISLDGDREPEGNAFGYVGPFPVFTGCPPNVWRYEDLTDDQPRWDLSQFAAECSELPGCTLPPGFVVPWDVMETFFMTVFPNHRVVVGSLVDDTFPGSPSGQGCAYYDLVSVGSRTITDHSDTAGGVRENGC
jgi:hypothetical protein